MIGNKEKIIKREQIKGLAQNNIVAFLEVE